MEGVKNLRSQKPSVRFWAQNSDGLKIPNVLKLLIFLKTEITFISNYGFDFLHQILQQKFFTRFFIFKV